MKLQSHIVKFASGREELFEKGRDYFNHYRAINGAKDVSYDATITFAEKEEKLNVSIKEEIARRSSVSAVEFAQDPVAFATNPMVNWATFAVIGALVDTILPETLISTIGMYTDIRVVGYGDSMAFDIEPRDLFVVSKAGRGKRQGELRKQYRGTVTVAPEARELSVYVDMYRVLAGFESLAKFMTKVAQSIETQVTYDAYAAFTTAMGGLEANAGSTQLRIAGYTQDAAVKLGQKVTAWNGGKKAVIVGTQAAVAKVLPDNGNFRFMLDSDYVKIGYLKNVFGFDVICLPQIADYTDPFATKLADNRLWFISPAADKFVKLVIGGGTISYVSGAYENANLTQTGTMIKSWGTGIAANAIAGVIELA